MEHVLLFRTVSWDPGVFQAVELVGVHSTRGRAACVLYVFSKCFRHGSPYCLLFTHIYKHTSTHTKAVKFRLRVRTPLTTSLLFCCGRLPVRTLLTPLWRNVPKNDCDNDYGSQGHEACVAYLLDAGADITATDEHDYTALHLASYYGRVGVVALLLRSEKANAWTYSQ